MNAVAMKVDETVNNILAGAGKWILGALCGLLVFMYLDERDRGRAQFEAVSERLTKIEDTQSTLAYQQGLTVAEVASLSASILQQTRDRTSVVDRWIQVLNTRVDRIEDRINQGG